MASPRIDYDYHQQQINEQAQQDPSITVQRYCEAAGLKYGSAKRYLKSPKKSKVATKVEKVRQVKASKPRAGARNWPKLYEQYLNDAVVNPTLNMTMFAEIHALPSAQVRKNFNSLRKTGDFAELEDHVADALAQYKGEKDKQKAKNKALNRRVISVREAPGVTAQKNEGAAKEGVDPISGSNDPLPLSQLDSGRDEFGRFSQGNRFSLVHGGYAQLTGLDKDLVSVATDIDPVNLANELLTARAQYMSMLRFVAVERDAIIQRYADGNPIKDFDDKEIPINKALGDLEFGTAGKLRALEASITGMVATTAKMTSDFTKLAHKEHELSPVSASQAVNIRQRIMKDRERHDWSALETAKRIEMYGVKPSRTLMLEVEKEIATYEPPVDDSGLSDEELEAQTQEYLAEQRSSVLNGLPSRREKVNRLLELIGDDGQEVGATSGLGDYHEDEKESPSDIGNDEDEKAVDFGDLADFAPLESENG